MSAAHKYGAVKVDHFGMSFSSKLEAAVYDILTFRERAGEISNIECQVQVSLTDAKIIYKPDFKFYDLKKNRICYAEAKGYKTSDWLLKKRLWKYYMDAPLEIWEGNYNYPKLMETVIPVNMTKSPSGGRLLIVLPVLFLTIA